MFKINVPIFHETLRPRCSNYNKTDIQCMHIIFIQVAVCCSVIYIFCKISQNTQEPPVKESLFNEAASLEIHVFFLRNSDSQGPFTIVDIKKFLVKIHDGNKSIFCRQVIATTKLTSGICVSFKYRLK